MDPLGHSPMAHVKLEGFKKKHDDHGPDASRPEKGEKRAIPNDHWEMHYSSCVYRNDDAHRGESFSPRPGGDRPTTYVKVNKEDH